MKASMLLCFLLSLAITGISQTPLTTAIQFEAKDYNGTPHDLFEYLDNDKYVLLSFYTLNCGSCQTYSPHVNTIYEQFGCNNADLVVLGVNWGADNNQLLNHHQQAGWQFPALSGFEGYGNEIISNYQIQSFISVILIAPNREIVNQYIYPPNSSTLENILESYGINPASCTVGTELLQDLDNSNIFPVPNPAGSFFSISSSFLSGNYYVSLYDTKGQLTRDYGSHSLPFPRFSLEGVEAGMYFVRIWDGSSTVYSTRIVVLP